MKVLVVLLLLAACHGDYRRTYAPVLPSDPAAIADLIGDDVVDGGLWFKDATCEQEFGAPQRITGPRAKTFARCVRALPLQASPRKDAIPDVAVLTYAPGFEIEARIEDDHLTWIGWEAERDGADTAPTLTAAAFAALRTDTAPPSQVESAPDGYAWLKICVDTSGNITNIDRRETTSVQASFAALATANAWQLRPFDAGNGAIPACAMVRFGTSAKAETLPWPPNAHDTGISIAPSKMNRIAGERAIVPDDQDKVALQRRNIADVSGAVRVCIDTEGNVKSVRLLKSTGLPGYDTKLLAGPQRWRYAPVIGPDGPVIACTGYVFLYSQR